MKGWDYVVDEVGRVLGGPRVLRGCQGLGACCVEGCSG